MHAASLHHPLISMTDKTASKIWHGIAAWCSVGLREPHMNAKPAVRIFSTVVYVQLLGLFFRCNENTAYQTQKPSPKISQQIVDAVKVRWIRTEKGHQKLDQSIPAIL